MISYSQNGEDIVLNRVLSHVKIGNYIDIGAGHPIEDSVTKIFYDRGWFGINVEPDNRLFPIYENERILDHNINACVSAKKGEVDYWQSTTQGWSTSNSEIALDLIGLEFVSLEKRPAISLDQVLDMADFEVNFLKIDCEGDEETILGSSNFESRRPWIIVVETVVPRKNESTVKEIRTILMKKNYVPTFFDGLNHYFVDVAHPELIYSNQWYPACALDDFITHALSKQIAQTKSVEFKHEEISNDLLRTRQENAEISNDLLRTRQENAEISNDLLRTRQELRIRDLELATIKNSRLWRSSFLYRNNMDRLKVIIIRLKGAYRRNPGPLNFSRILIRYLLRQFVSKSYYSSNLKRFSFSAVNAFRSNQIDIGTNSLHRRSFGSAVGIKAIEALSMLNQNIYILVGATLEVQSNTGVQKVVKSILEAEFGIKQSPILVRIELKSRRLIKLNDDEIRTIVRNSRINPDTYIKNSKQDQGEYPSNGMLFVPEVPYVPWNDPLLCDVLLAYCNSFNLTPSAIYYDSIPITTTGYEYGIESHLSYLRFLSYCKVITCISETSKLELNRLLSTIFPNITNESPEILVQHLPLSSAYLELAPKAISTLIGKKFALTVGTVEPRKNQITTILAFNDLEDEIDELPILVIAGGIRLDVAHWQNEIESRKIIWLGNVTDEEMIWLYQNCVFTIFVSKQEGFGYPVLESAHFGKVCITSSHGSMSEIASGKPFKLLQNVENVEELKANIRDVLKELNEKRILEVATFVESPTSWATYVEEFLSKVRNSSSESLKGLEILFWVDHTSQYAGNSGIQRVVRGLAESILSHEIPMTPVIWNPREGDFQLANKDQLNHLSNWSGPDQYSWNLDFTSKPRKDLNRILIIPELTTYSPDEHFLKKVILRAKTLNMMTSIIFFDALPVLMPEIYPVAAAYKHSAYMDDLFEADVILAISNSARNDLVNHCLSSGEIDSSGITKILAMPLPSLFVGESEVVSEVNQIDLAQKSKITILCVGTLELRKNYFTLVDAFEKVIHGLPDKSVELIIIGKGVDSKVINCVEQATEKLPIRWLGQVSDEVLKYHYKMCDFTVFPSSGEGFGLPLTESLGYGKPVVCGSAGALQENASLGGCLVVNVLDSSALALGISELINNSELLRELQEEIENRKFIPWNTYASNLLEVSFRIQKKVV